MRVGQSGCEQRRRAMSVSSRRGLGGRALPCRVARAVACPALGLRLALAWCVPWPVPLRVGGGVIRKTPDLVAGVGGLGIDQEAG